MARRRGSTSSPVSKPNTLPWYLNSRQYTLSGAPRPLSLSSVMLAALHATEGLIHLARARSRADTHAMLCALVR